ncbi:type IV toxin-antitoxin system AbiEi family antitoxin [Mangrovihabitans endophyticus]|uniref:AbiEi antitoxin C-terminal domain-containing protein n=1 Tax=Mangrovihabitans endophyticus TaxID=1751298 RepID=A0A8J3BZ41_9ACTN|nr:type IV toxin-antitoxin system AbiEi family antitoxin [Mangrovihabitans endophyticus]GGK92082.1 hypothetical protein GCM10012284_27420 [Mangrovihabitans endophyticus]
MLRGASWRRLFPDVYVHRDAELDHTMWCRAVVLTLPDGAALGGVSAALLWGVDLLPGNSMTVSVVMPRRRRLRADPRIVPHYTVLAERDVTHVAGMPVTTPERTLFDLARRNSRAEAVVAVDAMLHQRLVTIETLEARARMRRHWPGLAQLREAVRLAEPLAESPMETRLRLLLHDAGLPAMTAQHVVRDPSRRLIARVDLALPERLLRCTADDVLRHPARTVRLVADTITELRRLQPGQRTPARTPSTASAEPVSGRSAAYR